MGAVFRNKEKERGFRIDYSSDASASYFAFAGLFTGNQESYNFKISQPVIVNFEYGFASPEEVDVWFSEPSWLEGEIEAEEDVRRGRFSKFNNAQSVLSFLHDE